MRLSLLLLLLAACASSKWDDSNDDDSTSNNTTAASAGTLTGPLAFKIAATTASSQSSGGGFTGKDNLSVFLAAATGTGCSEGDGVLSIQTLTVDDSDLVAGTFPIHPYRGDEPAYARLDLSGTTQASGASGTLTLDALDIPTLTARGSFTAHMDDGSDLSGTFDTAGKCKP